MRFNTTDYLEARTLAELAIKLDPNYAFAWATLGFTWWWDGRLGYTGDSESKFQRADELAHRAMELNNTVSWVIGLNALAAAPLGRYAEGVEIARRGVALYPSNADIRGFLAFSLMHAAQYEEAVQHFRAAMVLNPFYPVWYSTGLSTTLRALGKLDESLTLSDEVINRQPLHLQSWLNRAYVYHLKGRHSEAKAVLKDIERIAPNVRAHHVTRFSLLDDPVMNEKVANGLRELGLPD